MGDLPTAAPTTEVLGEDEKSDVLGDDQKSEALEVEEKSEEPLEKPAKIVEAHRIPEWFRPGIVRNSAELQTLQTTLTVTKVPQGGSSFESGDPEDSTTDPNAAQQPEIKRFEITHDLYSELQDVVSAAMVLDNRGVLCASETGVFLTYPKGSLDFCHQVLAQLAKEMGASLIELDLEDLEDFAELLDARDDEPKSSDTSNGDDPNRKTVFGLTKHYFAVPSTRHATEEARERPPKAVASILDCLDEAGHRTPDGTGRTSSTSQPVLLHLYDEQALTTLKRGYRIYARIWEALAERRKKGEQLVLIASASEDGGDYDGHSYYAPPCAIPKIKQKIRVGKDHIVALTDGNCNSDRDSSDSTFQRGSRNLRHLKRVLRRRIVQNVDIHVDGIQKGLFNGLEAENHGDVAWTDDDVQRAATQIAGRYWRNPNMDHNDVLNVLSRIGLYTPPAEKDDSSSESPVDTPASGDESVADENEIEEKENDEVIAEEDQVPDIWRVEESTAQKEWEEQKKSREDTIEALDGLMGMIGLESVKRQFMRIKNFVDSARRQEVDLNEDYFGCTFVGNPGTGKTTVAALYAKLLSSLNIVPGEGFRTITGTELCSSGISECKKFIKKFEESELGGVILVDDAHQLVNPLSSGGGVLDYLTSEVERLRGKVVFIFAGYPKPMESFLGSTPGLQSRIPFTVRFEDYKDGELYQIFVQLLKRKFGGKMRVEEGLGGLYMRVLIRRIGRARGRASFANARQVQNILRHILTEKAQRLASKTEGEAEGDDLFLTKTDLIGPPPSAALEGSEAWKKLQAMIGLESVKEEVEAFINKLQINYNREVAEQPLVECSLNKVFLGNPGTGKTTVAKYYGQILADIGLLSNGEVMTRTPADFIGSHLGESEQNTKAILSAAQGKVLIIDEAYGLSGASNDGSVTNSDNQYKTAVVDTIVAEVQNTANEDRCVLLLGYKDRMETMFQTVNPALGRRFPLSSAFDFADYSEEQMRQILERNLQAQGFTASDEAKEVAMSVLGRARHHRNYGNAGEVDIILDQAKLRQQKRLRPPCSLEGDDLLVLEPADFDPDFDRTARAETSIREIMQDFVGADALVEKLEGYQRIVQNAKAMGLDPRSQIPFTFLFRGPPGTGKTTMARRMGQVFYNMGLLGTTEVIGCSATDLIGEYVGHTGPKTKRLVQRALGKVLFIDEAYHLSESRFGRDAVVEMMNLLTHETYQNKVITILAGYDEDIDRLLSINPGMSSRFPEALSFNHLSPGHCQELLIRCLQEKKLTTGTTQPDQKLLDSFQKLSKITGWANARDVQALAKSIFGTVMKSPTLPSNAIADDVIHDEMDKMLKERQRRAKHAATRPRNRQTGAEPPTAPPPEIENQKQETQTRTRTATAPPKPATQHQAMNKVAAPQTRAEVKTATSVDTSKAAGDDNREPGVSDAAWAQLQKAKMQAKERKAHIAKLEGQIPRLEDAVSRWEKASAEAGSDSARAKALMTNLGNAKRYLDTQRNKLKEAMSEEEREDEILERLLESGLCPLGYQWLREGGGYRCAGGTHYKSHEDILQEYDL